jgi:hypothetical protein
MTVGAPACADLTPGGRAAHGCDGLPTRRSARDPPAATCVDRRGLAFTTVSTVPNQSSGRSTTVARLASVGLARRGC